MNLKVATYNISHCQDYSVNFNDDAPVNIKKMAELIKNFNSDIIALNEVYIKGVNEELNMQTEKIAQITEHQFFSQAIGEDLGWAAIGNAILTKYPIIESFSVPVLAPVGEERRPDENDWYEDRVILGCELKIEEKEILVLATHFGLNGLEQEKIVKALCDIIDNANTSIILMGDFNLLPHREVLSPIYDRLVSCADATNNADYTFPSFEADRTLDYIFISKDISIKNFEVKKDIVSDHLPCVSDLEF